MKQNTRNTWKTTMTFALVTLLVSASAALAADDVRLKQDNARQDSAAAVKAGSGEEIEISDPTTGRRTAACLAISMHGTRTCAAAPPPPPPPSGGNRVCDFMNAVFGDAIDIQFLCP